MGFTNSKSIIEEPEDTNFIFDIKINNEYRLIKYARCGNYFVPLSPDKMLLPIDTEQILAFIDTSILAGWRRY